ncbi:sensor histidine kinase [Amycolatopsis antarctica]|uniref:histidine kinase n=1 Tax=Amycolatopsis antarctica TaxID=1854586 RepID=A0A263CV41_9PSEU|nr:histidine kinase [Amycolatopsis antarctica]OZM69993.1 sensor histidine kinase [Amycolatopsis antarctica]
MQRNWSGRAGVLLEVGVFVLIGADVWYETRQNGDWELVAGLVLTTLTLVLGRRLPAASLAVAAFGGLIAMVDLGGRFPAWPVLLMIAAGYYAGRRMETVRPVLGILAAVTVVALPVSLTEVSDGLGSWLSLLVTLLFAAFVPWHLGHYLRLRADLERTGWRRAEELEARQRITAEQARLRERARIASDMHDSLGHELSLIALRAATLELSSDVDERHRAAAGELRESAATATERLRQIIGVLREDAPPPVEPADTDVAGLVERVRGSGVALESRVDDVSDAPPMVRRAVYRVVQEALTNVTKHAPGAAASVWVECSAAETVVVVRNARPPAGSLPGVPSGQHGLVGLRERVRLVGGTLAAGPSGDGFEVRAGLPHDAAPAADAPETEAERSESARELASARRRVRRTLAGAVAAPAVVIVVATVVGVVQYAYNWSSSTLDPLRYNELRLGESRVDIGQVLPRRQTVERPDAEPERPPGSRCEYYRTDRSLFELSSESYRLCFDRDLLVSKDLIPERRGDE